MNTRACQMFGYAHGSLANQSIDLLVPAPVRDHHMQYRTTYAHAPRLRTMGTGVELLGRRRDGTECPIDVLLKPWGDGEASDTIAIVRDMTTVQATRAAHEKQLQTIMLTGDIADSHVKKAKRVAERILPKPVDVDLLLNDMTELLSQGADGENAYGSSQDMGAERSLEARCDPAFTAMLTPSHLHILEDHPQTVYGVWPDLTLAYMNPAWFIFASRNGGDSSIRSDWPVGRSTLDAVPDCLRAWYGSFFAALSSKSAAPKQHEYECSTAELQRRFLVKVYPAEGEKGRGQGWIKWRGSWPLRQ